MTQSTADTAAPVHVSRFGAGLTLARATIASAGLTVLAFVLTQAFLVGVDGSAALLLAAPVAFVPSLGIGALISIGARAYGNTGRRHGPAMASFVLAAVVGSTVLAVGVCLSNVLLVDFPTEPRTLAGCAASCVLGLLAFAGCRRWSRGPRIRAAFERRWREALVTTAVLVGVAVLIGDAVCFPFSFPSAHTAAILLALVGFACAARIVCGAPLFGTRVRALFRLVGAASCVFALAGGLVATRRGTFDGLMRVPSAGRTLLVAMRGLLDRDGDGYSALLGGGDCDDDDSTAFPRSKVGRDCLDLAPVATSPTTEHLPSVGRYDEVATGDAPRMLVLVTIDAFRCGFGRYERAELVDPCPSLTELGREGLLQTHAHARAPHTVASLAAIMAFRGDGELVTLPAALKRRGYRTAAIATHRALLRDPALRASFDDPDDSLVPISQEAGATTAEEVTTRALAKLQTAAHSGEPTFLWVHYYDTHDPYVRVPGSRWVTSRLDAYVEEVKRTDRAIGRLTSSLKELFTEGELAMFVTADHGEEFSEHGGTTHGRTLHEEVVRVPFLSWRTGSDPQKGLPADLPAGGIDMAPYVMSVVTGASFEPSESVLMEANPVNDAQVGVVRGSTKYILHYQLGYEELFDLSSDPAKHDDLSAKDVEQTASMRKVLGEHLHLERQHPRTL